MKERMRSNGETARSNEEPIAIIGIGCHFPGQSKTPRRFWELIRDGRDAITRIPRERFDADAYYDPTPEAPGKSRTREGGFVEGIEEMDPVFAGIAPKNAHMVDPQHRMLGAVAWAALEDAGIPPLSLDGSLTGVFVGLWSVEYWHRLAARPIEQVDAMVVGGNIHCLASGSISYLLGLRGPSLSLDTACSSSMMAADLAVQSLRSGASDLAIAGGVNLLLGPENFIGFSSLQVLAADGRCKSFDAGADGFGRGEGAGVLVLKRLADALGDGDRIQAVIHGSGVTQDGRTAGMAVPNEEAQIDAARRALAQTDLAPTDIAYAEAHGTGTPVGDPIEARALGAVYGVGRPQSDPLLLGSVKTNIGHLESAAGVASLIKVVLALQNEALPPSLHFETPNPEIPWDTLPVKVVTELTPWPRGERPRYAAVSSFGVSGTNVHMILGEGPVTERRRENRERPRHLLVLSARDKDALKRQAANFAEHFKTEPGIDLGDACHTAATGRTPFRERLAVVGASADEMRKHLEAFGAGQVGSTFMAAKASTTRPPLGFLFTGQGSQYPGMGRGLYETQPAFRAAMDRCDQILRGIMGCSILEVIYPPSGVASPVDDTTYAQPALFALEYSVCEMWRSWGIEPDYVIGHSAGEDVAACVAGVFSLEDGLRLIAERGRLMGALPKGIGAMVAIMTSEDRIAPRVAPHGKDVSIATLNGPENVVISGREEAVLAIARSFEADGVETRRLKVSHAFHSPLMDAMLVDFHKVASSITYHPARIPLVSNLSGALAGDELLGPDHWVTHIQKPVRYAEGVAALQRLGCKIFLEVGPKPTLARISEGCLAPGSGVFLPTLQQGHDDWERTLLTLGELFARGIDVDWEAFDAGYGRRKVALPTYPTKGQRYFVDAPKAGSLVHGNWLQALLAARKENLVKDEIRKSGRFSEDEAHLLSRLLDVFAEEYERRTAPKLSVVAEYYNAIPEAAHQLIGGSKEELNERYLTFGPLHERPAGFSWVSVFSDPENHQEWAQLCFESQKEMRAALFRHVDFEACKSILDFGCGYSSDITTLALRHPHLKATGYTIAAEQAKIGARKIQKNGIEDRVQVFNRDSARDEFPGNHDLVFGFEVAHHVPDKKALFGNIGRHLNEGGHLVLADFISRTGFSIDHDETSSFFITKEEWSELLGNNGIEVVDCIDISQEIANFLWDPNFDDTLAKIDPLKADANIKAGFKSYDQLGKLLRKRLTDYVLLAGRKTSAVPVAELKRRNLERLTSLIPYSRVALAGGCFEVDWVAKEKAPVVGAPGHWLVFADRDGVGAGLARRVALQGGTATIVEPGSEFGQVEPGRWTVNPSRPEHYARLLAEVGRPQRGFRVAHLWSLDAAPVASLTAEGLAAGQDVGASSLLLLVQALAESKAGDPRLWVVTRRAQALGGAVEVAQAPVVGLAKSILLEHPELWGGMVDVDAGDVPAAASALVAESSSSDGETHVAYREGKRYVARVKRRRLPAGPSVAIQPDATYLVTGGLGALGQRVAGWLVDQGARNLVLTGRRAPVDAALSRIRELEARGVKVVVAEADVAKAKDVAVLAATLGSLPPLKGIVHAAGVLDDGVLLQQTPERFRAVLAPKVMGTFNLHEATKDAALDFFVCFSSSAALFGSAGQGNYAAANAFMDAFAHQRRAEGRPGLSVNWGAWADSGMAASLTEGQRRQLAESGIGEIAPREGLRLLGELIAEGHAQVGVSPMNWEAFFKAVPRGQAPPYLEALVPVAAGTDDVKVEVGDLLSSVRQASSGERRDLIARYLQERVAKVVGYQDPSQVDRELTLLELGFDSLMAVQLRNALRSNLGTDVPIGKLFDSTSVDGLADLLQERLVAAQGAGEQVEVL